MKFSSVLLSGIVVIGLSACSSEKHTSSGNEPAQPKESPEPQPSPTEEAPKPGQGLVGSIWTMQSRSSDGTVVVSYSFEFAVDALNIVTTCQANTTKGELNSKLSVHYSSDGKIAQLLTGIHTTIPISEASCGIEIPQGLVLELDGEAIFLNKDGKRWRSTFKRQP